MAVNSTTLGGPLGKNDVYALLAATTGCADGRFVLIGQELCACIGNPVGSQVLLRRGLDGTVVVAHASGEPVQIGLGTDLSTPLPGADIAIAPALMTSYSANGAITPTLGTALLVGSTVLAMTLAAPAATLNGTLTISSTNGVAHTVTVAGGLGGGGSAMDIITFPAATCTVVLQAINGKWNQITLGGAVAA